MKYLFLLLLSITLLGTSCTTNESIENTTVEPTIIETNSADSLPSDVDTPISDAAINDTVLEASTLDKYQETPQEPAELPLPATAQLDVPFTVQAPHAHWELPYQEACEEASILMAARFLQGRSIESPDDADKAILQLVHFGTELGYPIDTTAAETANTLEQFYDGLQTEVITEVTVERIKQAIAQGDPVIVPTAGQQLGNPNFTSPGPVYHMLVITGYTETHFITNDPGTRNGANYKYTYNTLLNAIHDWNNGDVANGQQVMIIVSK